MKELENEFLMSFVGILYKSCVCETLKFVLFCVTIQERNWGDTLPPQLEKMPHFLKAFPQEL